MWRSTDPLHSTVLRQSMQVLESSAVTHRVAALEAELCDMARQAASQDAAISDLKAQLEVRSSSLISNLISNQLIVHSHSPSRHQARSRGQPAQAASLTRVLGWHRD